MIKELSFIKYKVIVININKDLFSVIIISCWLSLLFLRV